MKFNTENALKRFLKRKVKITLGLVVTFMITGTALFAEEKVENITENKTVNSIKVEGTGFDAEDRTKTVKIENGKTLTIDMNESSGIYVGIRVDKSGGTPSRPYGYPIYNENLTIEGGNIDIFNKVTSDSVTGINNNAELTIQNVENLNIDVKATNKAYGMKLTPSMSVNTVEGDNYGEKYVGYTKLENIKNLTINAEGDKAYGILLDAASATNGKPTVGKVSINAENINITAKGNENYGIYIQGNQNFGIEADYISINAENGKAIYVSNSAGGKNEIKNSFKINEDGEGTVQIKGDIIASSSNLDTSVINFSDENSYLEGKLLGGGKTSENLNVGFSDGAEWKLSGDNGDEVTNLTLDGGKLTLTDGGKVNIEKLNASGDNKITLDTEKTEDGIVVNGGVNISNLATSEGKKADFELGFNGINADDINNDITGNLNELRKGFNVTDGEDNIENITAKVEQGYLYGEITAEYDKNGEINTDTIQQAKESDTVTGLKDLATINYLSWKQEMGSLTQRMGELRNSSADHGVWARVYGGKVENGSQYDNEYQTYQVGYDKKYSVNNGNVFLGYLVSYTDGETNYSLGSGENYSVGAGIYATWMNNNGHYVDVLYKVSRLNNKFDVGSSNNTLAKSSGEYDTYGISLSAEYGKRFDITEKWFAEPSVGMHFGRLGDETYTTSSGVEVSQDSIYTAEGRIGTALGYKFSDKGNVYARAHVVKEFAGDIDAEYKFGGKTNSTSEDLSDTWFEFGIGTNYRIKENVNLYADIEKTGDATVDTEWQGNLGFRWEF